MRMFRQAFYRVFLIFIDLRRMVESVPDASPESREKLVRLVELLTAHHRVLQSKWGNFDYGMRIRFNPAKYFWRSQLVLMHVDTRNVM